MEHVRSSLRVSLTLSLILFAVTLTLGLPAPVFAKDITVHWYVMEGDDPDPTKWCMGTSLQLGTTAHPFTGPNGIQTAIDSAGDGDTIHVAAGVYFSTVVFPAYDDVNDVAIDLTVIKEDWSPCPSGDAVIDGTGSSSQTGVRISGRQSSATLFTGFTVQNWTGPGGGGTGIRITTTESSGGSPNGFGCSPTIDHCLIVNNSSIAAFNAYGGGGMQIAWYCNPTVQYCWFEGNQVTDSNASGFGGAIWIYGAFASASVCDDDWEDDEGAELKPNPLIFDCDFIGNTATNHSSSFGGAIAITCGIADIIKCRFIQNDASAGGGAIYGHLCDDTLVKDCTFDGNTADVPGVEGEGGAIYIEGRPAEDDGVDFKRVHLIQNEYIDNSAAEGGAIYIVDRDVTISHSKFTENNADVEGAALWCGAKRFEGGTTSWEIYHICNLYWENTVTSDTDADGEAVIFFEQPSNTEPLICTSFNNTIAENPDVRGVTLVNNHSMNYLEFDCANEILYFNGDMTNLSDLSIHQFNFSSLLTVTYSDTEQVILGTGNIQLNPDFASSTDFHLLTGSRCIDEGDNNAWDPITDPTVPDWDLDSTKRKKGLAIDMGCYEF